MKRQNSQLFCSGDGRKSCSRVEAFTIVELLVVIVVIGILAAVTIVSYSGISNQAIAAMLKSDLDNNSKLLKMYNVEYGYYPDSLGTDNCPNAPTINTTYCLKASKGASLNYNGGGQNFVLTSTHAASGTSRQVTENGISYAVSGNGNISSFFKTWGGVSGDEGYSIAKTGEGGYVIVGRTLSFGVGYMNIAISKFTSEGELSWARAIGISVDSISANSIIQTTDGGYVICGNYSQSEDSTSFVARLSSNGALIWNKTYRPDNRDTEANSITQLSDGNLVAVGRGWGSNLAFMVEFDFDDGDMNWNRIWTADGVSYARLNSVVSTSDGGFIASGDAYISDESGWDVLVVKMQANGSLSWNRTWGGDGDDNIGSVVQTSDGGYAFTGMTYSSFKNGYSDVLVAKLKSDGSVSWVKSIGATDYELGGTQVIQTFDGSLVISTDWLLTINMSTGGNLSWAKHWDPEASSELKIYSVAQLTDGGFVLTGFYTNPSYDVLSFKIRTDGSMRNCSPGVCNNITNEFINKNISIPSTDQSALLQNPTAVTGILSLTESNINPTVTTIVAP